MRPRFSRFLFLCAFALTSLLAAALVLGGCSSGTSGGSSTPAPVAPQITTQPTAQSAYVGAVANFSVAASGTAPLSYQWLKNGTAISGATGTVYTTPALALSDDGGLYSVTVSNSAGTVTSSTAKLSVSAQAPSITTQPASTSVTEGSSATFTVAATGTAPLTYQWQRNGTAISGATSAGYTLSTTAVSDSKSVFTAVVSNSAGSVTSSAATLTVLPAPVTIKTQPAGASVFVGETATFSVVASGTSPTYQWRKNGTAISGATASTYTTPALAATDDKATFDVVVSNAANSLASSAATVRVGPFATAYTTQKGVVLSMYAWPGTKNAILTKTAALDTPTMRRIVTVADGTYNYYAGAVGKTPSLYFNYNGLATIADTGVGGVDLCGDGCTFVGATGMELSDNAWGLLYQFAQSNEWDQVMFYEFGRSFWLFGSQLTQSQAPNYGGCITTGFAVLMRYRSIAGQNLQGIWNQSPAGYAQLVSDTAGLIDNYANNSSLNFANTFFTGSYSGTSGLGCADLFASMVLRLAQNYGGETFIQALWKQALLRPAATTPQDAYDNFILAASAAANHNLTGVFQSQWRWPVSTSALNEATSRWGAP